ncbi:MAG: sensor histidine kinase [Acidobacteria bacterium]|nr:sensor histidine kinase [Acidobacteriota bacterium]
MAAVNLTYSYNYALVALSVLIAMFASYVALDIGGRVMAAFGWTRAVWLLGGAVAMGTGIWSMHYIGMLAFILPVPVAYHWPTVLLSLFAAIVASAIALYVVSRRMMNAFRALAGSVLMGAGIASMHYIGMAAMRLPAMCHFSSFLVVLSVVAAVLISLAALWITFHFRDEKAGSGWEKTAGAVVMGAAIPVMHYTGMEAASFTLSDMPVDLSHAVSISTLGTLGIAAVTLILLGLALLTSWLDKRFAVRTLELQEEKLKQSEAYLSEAQQLSHTGSFGWRLATGEVLWSEETFRIFQYDRTTTPTVELVLQRVHPEDAAFVKQTIARATQDGKDFDFEYRLLMPEGSVKYVHVVAHALTDESGGIEFAGAVMDVTEQHQARADLEKAFDEIKKSEGRLQLVIDTIPGMVWSGLPDGAFDFINEPWLRYLGCSWEELSARGGLRSVVHPDDLEGSDARWSATRAAGRHIDHELRMRGADGQYRWFLTRALPLRDDLGNIIKWYGTATDIEDRKLAEVLLGGEKRLLEMIARGDSRALILDALCRLVEELAGGCLSSILLLDPNTNCLRHGAAPSLPPQYSAAIDGIVIGPSVGSCGTAAYRKEQVIVSDITTDPLWADFRELALAHGLRACWSTPILSSAGGVLGTFAIYYGEARSPTPQDSNVIGQITHLASIALERAQAAQALQQQASLLEQAHDAILVWEFPRTIVYWNRGAEQLYGFSRKEAIGRSSHELLHTEHPQTMTGVEQALERDGEWTGELTHTTRDGRKIIVESRHVLMSETDGRRLVLETNRDITERKLAELAQLRLGAIVASSDDAIISKTLEGVITSWNAGAQRIFGYAAEEAVGRPITILIPPDRQDEELQIIERLRRGKSVHHFETVRVRKDGRRIDVSLAISPIKDSNGQVVGISKIAREITERKRAAEALRQAKADLAHVNRVTTMGELTASLAHEVNQPITAAVTNANTCLRWLTRDQPDLDEARAAAARIVKDGTRAGEIISRIRLLFKKGLPEREMVDANEVIQEMIVLLQGEATRYSISVRSELSADIPQFMGDRVQLQQVVMNLIMNSIDAMKDLEGTRELSIKSELAENEQLLVSVSDTGVGLPQEQLDQIFNAFVTTKLHGTGMGLSISRSIVESHGGRLWAADNSPRGASFHFTLPTEIEAPE